MDFSSFIPKIFGGNKSSDDAQPAPKRTVAEQNPFNAETQANEMSRRNKKFKEQLDEAEE